MTDKSTGKVRVSLTESPNGEALVFYDDESKPRAAVALNKDGAPTLAFLDAAGPLKAAFGVRSDGQPSMVMVDNNPQIVFGIVKGFPVLAIMDEQGDPRVALTVTAEHGVALYSFDKDGHASNLLATAGHASKSEPEPPFSAKDIKEFALVTLGGATGAGLLELFHYLHL